MNENFKGDLHGCIGCKKANTFHRSCCSKPSNKILNKPSIDVVATPLNGYRGDQEQMNTWSANLVATLNSQRR